MTEWFEKHGYPTRNFFVVQVLGDGLLLKETTLSTENPVFLRNYSAQNQLTDNAKIQFLALRDGTYSYTDVRGAQRTIEAYDYGVPVTFSEADAALHITEKAAAKAAAEAAQKAANEALRIQKRSEMQANTVARYQSLADKGDAYGELRLGEFYRDGDGVTKDEDKARELFKKSADQGNKDAEKALSKMQ
jgi:TPR repeat protein